MSAAALLHTDGGSRGNPGIAGCGFTLADEGSGVDLAGGWFIPHATNNVAEYAALVWGLQNAHAAGIGRIEAYADSELMVKQMTGAYKVKSPDLKPLVAQAQALAARFSGFGITHVYRSENKRADALANEAMDGQAPCGTFLVPWEGVPGQLFAAEAPLQAAAPGQASGQGERTGNGGCAMERNPPYEGPGRLSGRTYESAGGTYELTVKSHFDAAHSLPGYAGPCRYLHGHTWDVEVTVTGMHLDEVGLLYDFKDIKADLNAVLENFDHRCINDVAPFDIINPTAEHLARVIFFELEHVFPPHILLKEVAVWESPLARISYRA